MNPPPETIMEISHALQRHVEDFRAHAEDDLRNQAAVDKALALGAQKMDSINAKVDSIRTVLNWIGIGVIGALVSAFMKLILPGS